MPRTRIWAIVIGVVLGLVGAVWFLQGIGVVKGSFMTGQPIWAIIGLVLLGFSARTLLAALRGNHTHPGPGPDH
jgi:hypothetical protein